MTMAMWLVPFGLAVFVLAYVAVCAGPPASSARDGWGLAPDTLRIAGWTVLLLGALAAVWVGIGDHQPRVVLSGTAPFDWAAATLVGTVTSLVGASLLLADRRRRRRELQLADAQPAGPR
jgi:hypothetical protein